MQPTFFDLGLHESLLKALKESGYTVPTPIQEQGIPILLSGRDLVGVAQTGTGKTAAFALPILQRLMENPRKVEPRRTRVLVLTPTRELAIQVDESFRVYGKHLRLKHSVVYGGVGQNPQVKSMSQGVDVLVATPGRLLDLIEQGYLSLTGLEVFVLDEADRMLDMGFIHAIRKILTLLPAKRHNLFFSATMPPDIVKLAASMLTNPARIEVTPASSTVELIDQCIMFVSHDKKRDLLKHVLQDKAIERAIIFTRTKHGANRVAELLEKTGVKSDAIHGNKSQSARQRALENFRTGKSRVLVATDLAARGIDIDDITHVINFEIPNIAESYVHRIGRTARAGAKGHAISFCDAEERAYLVDIQKLIKKQIRVAEHPFHAEDIRLGKVKPHAAPSAHRGGQGRSGPSDRQPSSRGSKASGSRSRGGRR